KTARGPCCRMTLKGWVAIPVRHNIMILCARNSGGGGGTFFFLLHDISSPFHFLEKESIGASLPSRHKKHPLASTTKKLRKPSDKTSSLRKPFPKNSGDKSAEDAGVMSRRLRALGKRRMRCI